MEKNELCRKIITFENGERRTLIYSVVVTEDETVPKRRFGAGIEIPETGESRTVSDISSDREKVLGLIDVLATGFVTPVSLGDVVYDFLCK